MLSNGALKMKAVDSIYWTNLCMCTFHVISIAKGNYA